jgi:hypothetical protein
MRNRLLTFAGLLALLAVIGKFYATPLMAQVRAALVKNIDEKGRIPYMQSGFTSCSSGSSVFCDITFPVVPANKRLVLMHVSANIGMSAGGVNGTFLLAGGNNTFSLPGRSMATPSLIGVNENVLAYFESGSIPIYRVVFDSASDIGAVSSVISGYLVDLTE